MRSVSGVAVALAGVLALGGCSLFGSDDEPEAAAEPTRAQAIEPVNVQAVRRLEIGRTRNGFALAAFGTAPGLGHSRPRLVARRGGAPAADGMLDYDFLLDPPPEALALPQGSARAREVRADVEIPVATAQAVRGVRVHAAAGGMQMLF